MKKIDIIIPYNINNKIVTDLDIKNIFNKFNIKIDINNINFYIIALTHKSYIKNDYYYKNYDYIKNFKKNEINLLEESNERLEFLGDTVIKLIIAEYLYDRYQKKDEGFMTKAKTKIENRENLSIWAKVIELDKLMIISLQNEDNFGRNSDKLLEDCFESFIGAVFKDSGFLICKKLILEFLENYVDWSEIFYKDCNYKDKLQKYYHSLKWDHPSFELLEEKFIDNKKYFLVVVKDNNNKLISTALDTSIKKAQQYASKLALYKFNQLSDYQMDKSDLEKFNL